MKECSKCGKRKNLNSFYCRKRGPRAGQYYEKCTGCMKARGRTYYHANRGRQLLLAKKRRRKAYLIKREFIIKTKNKPCSDCGKRYAFYVMDFDHRDHKDKVGNVATMFTRNWSLDKIRNEVKKCDIVCANCHRIRTYRKLYLN